MKKPKSINTTTFDRVFDAGQEDVLHHADLSTARRGKDFFNTQRVNVDLPGWVIASLDSQARMIGISRQALIKTWIHDRLKQEQTSGS